MKIIFPKTIQIGADTFKVVRNHKQDFSDFSWKTMTLTIGTKNYKKRPESLLTAISHEIFEMWSVSLYIRYARPDTYDNYIFHFDHRLYAIWVESAINTLKKFFL